MRVRVRVRVRVHLIVKRDGDGRHESLGGLCLGLGHRFSLDHRLSRRCRLSHELCGERSFGRSEGCLVSVLAPPPYLPVWG